MSDAGLRVGIACLSGAYLMANLAALYWLISRQKARLHKEAQRDHFFDKNQTVLDLTCLMNLNIEDARKALLGDKFKTPMSEGIVETLSQTDKPDWQKIYLSWKTRKGSYDDLMKIEASLKEKNMPYLITTRKNLVRSKKRNDFLLSRECISTSQGHIHRDLKRHMISQLSQAR